jgi:outer membrane biosynthesis protein TonB
MASVEVTIGSDGNVVTVNACNGPAVLCRTATEAIRRSRWNPVLVNGTAVETTTTVEFVFSLGGGSGGGGPVR